MRRGATVISPDGHRWEVRRRWSDSRLPELRRRFREARQHALDEDMVTGFWGLDFSDGIVLTVGSLVVLALLLLVLVPLLGVALELAVALALAGAGIVGRLLFGHPWTVEAVDADDPERGVAYAVKGWSRSRRALEELRGQIAVAGTSEGVAR